MPRGKRKKIDGPFYPWTIEMGRSLAMRTLRQNSYAVMVFNMFVSKYSLANDGKNLYLTYKEVKGYMSPATFARAKLWCMALGFIHCTRFGRLERNASLYDLSSKWKVVSSSPEKLARIVKLLYRRDKVARLPAARIHDRGGYSGGVRKKMLGKRLEKAVLGNVSPQRDGNS